MVSATLPPMCLFLCVGACGPQAVKAKPCRAENGVPCSRFAPARTTRVFRPVTANPTHCRLASRVACGTHFFNEGFDDQISKSLRMPTWFDALLSSAEEANTTRQQERACAHLLGTMELAVPFYRDLIEHHHRAMLAGELETVMQFRDEAHLLAVKLNSYEPGILADDDAPGYALDRAARAPDGAIPLWGPSGSFEITSEGMRVRIEMEGMFASALPSWRGRASPRMRWTSTSLS